MTDSLMQKLEEKVMSLVTELEVLRRELHQLRQENSAFKAERNHHTQKLISLLDALDVKHSPLHCDVGLVQGNNVHAEELLA